LPSQLGPLRDEPPVQVRSLGTAIALTRDGLALVDSNLGRTATASASPAKLELSPLPSSRVTIRRTARIHDGQADQRPTPSSPLAMPTPSRANRAQS